MILTRRTLLCGALATLVCAPPAAAHTPFRQWVVYRKKHLLIGAHRGDDGGYATAKIVADYLAEHLPASSARVARAPAAHRLASLMATDQLDLAILSPEEAAAMAAGDGVFAAYGKLPLRLLVQLADGRLLVAHSRFRDDHAALVIEALTGSPLAPADIQGQPAPILPHPGHAQITAAADAPAAPWEDPRRQPDLWSDPITPLQR